MPKGFEEVIPRTVLVLGAPRRFDFPAGAPRFGLPHGLQLRAASKAAQADEACCG